MKEVVQAAVMTMTMTMMRMLFHLTSSPHKVLELHLH